MESLQLCKFCDETWVFKSKKHKAVALQKQRDETCYAKECRGIRRLHGRKMGGLAALPKPCCKNSVKTPTLSKKIC